MQEIVPDLFHWTRRHPGIDVEVSSYFWQPERLLLDPMLPEEGLEWFRQRGEPAAILLTNRHHDRDSAAFVEAFGCPVRCPEAGLHEYEGKALKPTGYRPGDALPGGVQALEVGVICPDETALQLPVGGGALAVADGLIRMNGELGFVPDAFLGDDPAAIKRGLRVAFGRIAEQQEFEHLLPAHGEPLIGGAREALRRFAAG